MRNKLLYSISQPKKVSIVGIAVPKTVNVRHAMFLSLLAVEQGQEDVWDSDKGTTS